MPFTWLFMGQDKITPTKEGLSNRMGRGRSLLAPWWVAGGRKAQLRMRVLRKPSRATKDRYWTFYILEYFCIVSGL